MPRIEGNSQINFQPVSGEISQKRIELNAKSSISSTESTGCLATIWQGIKNFFSSLFSCFFKSSSPETTNEEVNSDEELEVDESDSKTSSVKTTNTAVGSANKVENEQSSPENIKEKTFNQFFEVVLKQAYPNSKLEDYATPEAREKLYVQAVYGVLPIETNEQMSALLQWLHVEQNPSIRTIENAEELTKRTKQNGYEKMESKQPYIPNVPPVMIEKKTELIKALKEKGINAYCGPCLFKSPVLALAVYLSGQDGLLHTQRELLNVLSNQLDNYTVPFIKQYREATFGKNDQTPEHLTEWKKRLVKADFEPRYDEFRALLAHYKISLKFFQFAEDTRIIDWSDKDLNVATEKRMAGAGFLINNQVWTLPIFFETKEDEDKFFKLR